MIGEGDLDLLWIAGFVSNVELAWEEPLLARFLNRLARFSRLIIFDKRGTGLSDRVSRSELPSLEERMDDVLAVLDAADSDRAAVMGHSEGGSLAVLYAATHPERVKALVTTGIFAKRSWSPDYPWAEKPVEREAYIEDWSEAGAPIPTSSGSRRARLAIRRSRRGSPPTSGRAPARAMPPRSCE